ncbi:MAG TPA: hypothetical protein VN324_14725 [Quisquiliibacterium sp.]|nr:hypothetical protein [Quisquiliibacterium sp.]
MTILVQEVRCRRAERAFFDLPRAINRNERRWIAPLASQERARWSPASNASLRCRDAVRFVAWRDRRPIGRIAAILDPAFQAAWDGEAGFFGFFDCVDDAACARALLGATHHPLCQGRQRIARSPAIGVVLAEGFVAGGFHEGRVVAGVEGRQEARWIVEAVCEEAHLVMRR